jgi:hypothetical protein
VGDDGAGRIHRLWKEARLLELLVWEGLHEDEEIDDAGLVCRYSLAGWSRCRGLARWGWRGIARASSIRGTGGEAAASAV